MAARNYIPSKLADRNTYFKNFADYVLANFAALGLLAADSNAIQAAWNTFSNAYEEAQTAATRSPVTIAALVTANNAMAAVVRQYAIIVNANAAVTDAQRAALQITIREVAPFGRIAAPATWPILHVRSIGPLQHVLSWRDSSYPSDSKVRSKPFGATSMQLFMHVGATPPADPAAALFVGNFTRLPVTVPLDPASVGQTAYYYARWVSNRGLEGPLVGPTTATVAAAAA